MRYAEHSLYIQKIHDSEYSRIELVEECFTLIDEVPVHER
jgi:hypothetical protein